METTLPRRRSLTCAAFRNRCRAEKVGRGAEHGTHRQGRCLASPPGSQPRMIVQALSEVVRQSLALRMCWRTIAWARQWANLSPKGNRLRHARLNGSTRTCGVNASATGHVTFGRNSHRRLPVKGGGPATTTLAVQRKIGGSDADHVEE